MPSFIGILQHSVTEFAQFDHENKLKQKNNVLFWIKFIAGKTTYVKYLIFSNSVQIWYDFQSHRTMRPQMQIFAHRAKQCAVCVLANNILTFWPLTLRLPPHQLHLWYLSLKKTSPLTFSHKDPSRPFQRSRSDHCTHWSCATCLQSVQDVVLPKTSRQTKTSWAKFPTLSLYFIVIYGLSNVVNLKVLTSQGVDEKTTFGLQRLTRFTRRQHKVLLKAASSGLTSCARPRWTIVSTHVSRTWATTNVWGPKNPMWTAFACKLGHYGLMMMTSGNDEDITSWSI